MPRARRIKYVSECIEYLYPDQAGLLLANFAFYQSVMDTFRNIILVGMEFELSLMCCYLPGIDSFNSRVVQIAILDEVGDGADFDTVFLGEYFQFRSLGHGAIFIHDLNDH